MSLRLRLALVLLLLSALPLAGLAFYSYSSSRAALRRAAENEAALLARDLEHRVGAATKELDAGVRALARLAPDAWTAPSDADRRELVQALDNLGPALGFIDKLSFVPEPPVAAAPPAPAVAPVAPVGGVAPVPAVPAPTPPPAQAPPVPPWPAGALTDADLARLRHQQEQWRVAMQAELERVRAEVARAWLEAEQDGAEATGRGGAGPDLAERERVRAGLERAERELSRSGAGHPVPPAAPPEPTAHAIGSGFSFPLAAGDHVLGELRVEIKADDLLRSVLAQTDRGQGEIPFALDADNRLYLARPEDAERVRELPALRALQGAGEVPRGARGDWVVVARRDPATGLRYGIARPLSGALAGLRAAAARNFSLGLLLVGLAVAGLYPLSGRLVRDVRRLEEGARRLAAGDLDARVEVGSHDELGRLAGTFNRMAGDLAEHQARLLEQERLRKEEEIARRLLAAENERRRRELEEAREFQLSLLPRELPRRPGLELAVSMTTATEVGGDYYDFLDAPGGALVIAVGDATGHGAAAGTMVTAVKGLFAGSAAGASPAAFLAAANAAVHRMGLVRRAMALQVARIEGRRVVLSAAGMPPALRFRAATGEVHEVELAGTPLGARAEFPYREATLDLEPGDALLLCSDGLPELADESGEPFGYERLARRFQELAPADAATIVAGLEATTAERSQGRAPADDVTFLVLKVH